MTLFFMLFPPLIEMIAFGYALDNDVKHMSMMVLNEDRTVESRQLIERFVNTETFRVVGEVQNVEQLASEIRKGNAYVGLQIPPHFTRDVRAGYPAQIQMLIDGSNSTTALQALNTGVALTLSQSLQRLMRETGTRHVPIEVRPQMLYNPTMRSPNFFVPGVIGVVLQIGTTFATAMAVVREREKGTLEQLLVSPLSSWGLMLGKLIPYLCLGMTMAVLLFAIMRFVFFVPIAGSVVAMLVSTFVYVFALLSLGLLVATKAENQMQALQMSMAFILPSVFFSGFIFPRETMPAIFYGIGAIMPTTYFIALMRAIILRGATFMEYWQSLAIMTAMAIALFCVCALRFRKEDRLTTAGLRSVLVSSPLMEIIPRSPNMPQGLQVNPVRLVLGAIGALGIIVTLFSALFGFVSIPTNSVGVKMRFGAYVGTAEPGLAYAIPYVDEIVQVPTQRLLKLEFGFATPSSTNEFQGDEDPDDTETMITGDLNTALVPWVVQYRITDPKMYLFGAREPEKTLRDLSESVMREVIGDRTVDEVLTIGRHDIETSALNRLVALCDRVRRSACRFSRCN